MALEKAHSPPTHTPICSWLHDIYQIAVAATIEDGRLPRGHHLFKDPDVLSISEHLLDILQTPDNHQKVLHLPTFDQLVFKNFMIGLAEVVRSRRNTVASTTFIENFTDFALFLVNWLNSEEGFNFDVKITSRRKSLEGELEKILDYALQAARESFQSSGIATALVPMKPNRDQYGIRFILASDDCSQLFELIQIFIGILTDPFDYRRTRFQKWALESEDLRFGGASVPKALILKMLEHTFWYSDVHDFITTPTPSTYQSWHATIHVDNDSPSMGGFMWELQVRTYEMHKNAENGKAARHDRYEELRRPEVSGIFSVDSYNGGIVFYDGPSNKDLDLDGLSTHAPILQRHASPHAVPRVHVNNSYWEDE